MRIALTGATGFIGGAIRRACRARGWKVFAYGRQPGASYWDITAGSLANPPEVDAVVHAAASVTDWGHGEAIWRVNVRGTRNVVHSFPGARFVHISSASVYDPFTPTVHGREEDAPVRRYLTAYAAAKASAELLLAEHPSAVILRPHAVYGPGDTTLLPRVLSTIRAGQLPIVGDGTTRHTLTSIDNLVDAVLAACSASNPPGIYNVGDAEPVSLDGALTELLTQRGLPVRIRHIPLRVAWPLAAVAESAYQLAGCGRAPRLTRYAISHLAYERTLDLSAAKTALGFVPRPTSFDGAASW